jgi:hypothetical protein
MEHDGKKVALVSAEAEAELDRERADSADSEVSSSSYDKVVKPAESPDGRERVDSASSHSSYDMVSIPSESTQKRGSVGSNLSYDMVPDKATGYAASDDSAEHRSGTNDIHTPNQSDGEYDVVSEGSKKDSNRTGTESPSPSVSDREQSDNEQYDVVPKQRTRTRFSSQSGSEHNSEQDDLESDLSVEGEIKQSKEKLNACYSIFYSKIKDADSDYVDKYGVFSTFFFTGFGLSDQDKHNQQLQQIIGQLSLDERFPLMRLVTELLNIKTQGDRYDHLIERFSENEELISIIDKTIKDKSVQDKIQSVLTEKEARWKKVRLTDGEELPGAELQDVLGTKMHTPSQSESEQSDAESYASDDSEIKEYKEKLKECFSIFYNKIKDSNTGLIDTYKTVCDFFFKVCGFPKHNKRSKQLQQILEQLTNIEDRTKLLDFSSELWTKKTRIERYDYLIQKFRDDAQGVLIASIDRAIKDKKIQDLVKKAQDEEHVKWLKLAPKVLPAVPTPLVLDSEMLLEGQFNQAVPALDLELAREEAEQLKDQKRIALAQRRKREEGPRLLIEADEAKTREEELISRNLKLVHKLRASQEENQRLIKKLQALESQKTEQLKEQPDQQAEALILHIGPDLSTAPDNKLRNQLLAIEKSAEGKMEAEHAQIAPKQVKMDEQTKREAAAMARAWAAKQAEAEAAKAQLSALDAQLRAFNAAVQALGKRREK